MTTFLQEKATWLFVGLCLLFVAIKLLFLGYGDAFPLSDQATAFTWPVVLTIVLIGFLGLLADRGLGFPRPLADAALERRSLVWAGVSGVLYGVVTIGMSWGEAWLHPSQTAEWAHEPLPWAIPFYTFGAIFLELGLRLGLLCIFVWLFHKLVFRGRFFTATFWTVNCIVALYEPSAYMIPDAQAGRWGAVALAFVQPLYLTNVFEGWLLFRFGWLSPIVFRFVFYLVWHVAYGGLAQPFVQPAGG
jgi:hypothetical protein